MADSAFTEIHVVEAFKYPSRLTESDLLELAKRMAKDARKKNAVCRGIFNAGSYDELEVAKQKRWSDNRRRNAKAVIRRELTENELDRLSRAWD